MPAQLSKVVCFGEILWDILPAGTVPGGAPMNVAYHLHQLNESPALVTRVGKDERGDELRSILERKEVDIRLLQTDEQYPTGTVYGTADEKGDMKYEIVAPSAWDFIQTTADNMTTVAEADYFVCGSLVARREPSRNTLFALLDQANTKVVDINLRPPFYSAELIEALITRADIVKLNNDELELISSWWGFGQGLREQADALQRRFNTKTIIVTRGSNGAAVWHDGRLHEHPGFKVKVADTVGSGDAFLAGFLHQRLQSKEVNEALVFACGLGALVASKSGAWPDYKTSDIYALTNL
ncbi:MAG: carbohydrate kinase [Citrobacter freundii]|nr:MAG: carbohydrate kinase [Citrobacter freundii]